MIKIIGIVGSSRKDGNTEILVSEALEAARESNCETELIKVAGKQISFCDGCLTCFKTGVCRIEDDMQHIYSSLESAHGIIIGTPSYFGNVSAQTKAILDRTIVFRISGKLRGKVAAALVATRRTGGAQILSLLYSYFIVQGMIVAGGGIGYGRDRGEVRNGAGGSAKFNAIEEARAVGKRVVKLSERCFSEKSL